MATYADAVKALLRAGLTNKDIIDLTKEDGRESVLRLGEEELAKETAK